MSHVMAEEVCQVTQVGLEKLACPSIESGGYRCERLDEHGIFGHEIGDHTKRHALRGNGYACSAIAPPLKGDGSVQLNTLLDQNHLRQYLDHLNENGLDPIIVGWDATSRPFLITLVGCYADSEDVLFDSPWQQDTNHGKMVDGEWVPHSPRCEECMAQVYEISDLTYPVRIMWAPPALAPHNQACRDYGDDANCEACHR